MNCWTCGFEMEPKRTDEVQYHMCPVCSSLVVPIMKSLPLWRAMDTFDVSEPEPMEGVPEATACGSCGKPIETFGYQFTKVPAQRCSRCGLLLVRADNQLDIRNVWRKANDREERVLARNAANIDDDILNHVSRPQRPSHLRGMGAGSYIKRVARAHGNAQLAQAEIARRIARDLEHDDD